MTVYRIMPDGKQFSVAETDGEAGILTFRLFETREDAQRWIDCPIPLDTKIIRWRDLLPPGLEDEQPRDMPRRSAQGRTRPAAKARPAPRANSARNHGLSALAHIAV
jgi:hypothetical protein